jgi:hypothetical protein
VVALMSSAVAGAAVKPQYRARLSCGAVPDDKVRTNRPFPWVVKILDKDGNFLSAGSLILDNLVLTSAQFVNRYATDCCHPSSVCRTFYSSISAKRLRTGQPNWLPANVFPSRR